MYTYVLSGIGIVVPLLYLCYWGVQKYHKKIQAKCTSLFVSLLIEVGTKIFSSRNPVRVEKRYMCIPYQYHGMDYQVYIPFSRVLRRKMLNTKTILIMENGEEQDISQQPGCCHLVTAAILGGKSIKVINYNTNETRIFDKNEIPVSG